jgi:hypothetical protein
MKRLLMLFAAGMLLAACAGPPELRPLPPAAASHMLDRCRRLFAGTPRRMVHAIAAELPGEKTRTVIGISRVSPQKRAIHAVLMTIEGLVLFDAVSEPQVLDVRRALPPFDSEEFARGLMRDVRLIFLEPDATAVESGRLDPGGRGCRYTCRDGRTVDVLVHDDGSWQLSLYHGRRLVRQLSADACRSESTGGIPCRLSLTARGRLSYHLSLSLIEAEAVQSQPADTE